MDVRLEGDAPAAHKGEVADNSTSQVVEQCVRALGVVEEAKSLTSVGRLVDVDPVGHHSPTQEGGS